MTTKTPACCVLALACLFSNAARAQAPVVITSNRPQLVLIDNDATVPLGCTTPCVLSLAPRPYRLHSIAPGARANEATFVVPPEGVTVRLRAASSAEYVWGVILSSIGAGALALAAVFVGVSLGSLPGDPYNQTMATMFGVAGGLIGGVSLTVGLALSLSNEPGIALTSDGR